MHYVCSGSCRGVAEQPKTCETKTCDMHGKELAPCACADGKHADFNEEDALEDMIEEIAGE